MRVGVCGCVMSIFHQSVPSDEIFVIIYTNLERKKLPFVTIERILQIILFLNVNDVQVVFVLCVIITGKTSSFHLFGKKDRSAVTFS